MSPRRPRGSAVILEALAIPLRYPPSRVCSVIVCEEPPAPSGDPSPPRLLDRVRHAIRMRHYSCRTERAYAGWIRRFVLFHNKRHPVTMGPEEITRYLSHLAVEGRVSASTQNQPLSALLFVYRDVLGMELPWMDDIVRARRPARLPVVLARGVGLRIAYYNRRRRHSALGNLAPLVYL